MSRDLRTTGVALLCTVALHASALVGVLYYSQRAHTDVPQASQTQTLAPIEAMLLSPPVAPSAAPPVVRATEPVAAHTATSPVARKQRVAPAEASVQPRQLTPDQPVPPAASPSVAVTSEAAPDATVAEAAHAEASDTGTQSDGGGATGPHPHPASQRIAEAAPAATPAQAAKPDYAYNPQPNYPMALREQGVGGVVWLRVWVKSDGSPGEVTLAKGSGHRLLDNAALQAVRQWRFIPAKQGDQALASWVEIPIRFTLASG